MLNPVREREEDYIEAIRYRRRLKIFENFLFIKGKITNTQPKSQKLSCSKHFLQQGTVYPDIVRYFRESIDVQISTQELTPSFLDKNPSFS